MKKKNIWFWISPIIFGILVLSIIRLVSDIPQGVKFWKRPISKQAIEITSIVIISYAIQYFLLFFIKYRKIETKQLTFKKLVVEYLLIIFLGLLITLPSLYIIHFLMGDPVKLDEYIVAAVSLSLLLVIYYSIFRGSDLLQAYINQKTITQSVKNTQMETELKFLKAQFHPHFLFNALNAIYFQIDEKNEAPRKSIEQLSELLRYQLYDINQTVRIEQELRFIRNYIEFQRVRMKDSFQLTVDFDHIVSDKKIHPLLLFPIVENAYKYVGGEYWIKMIAYLQNGNLCFIVENAVPQIPQAKNRKASGIGLENFKRRLNLLYPGKHSFETKSTENSFTAKLRMEW